MSDMFTDHELTGIRTDLNLLLGIDEDGNEDPSCTLKIERRAGRTLDTDTALYTETWTTIEAATPAFVYPVVFRRGREVLVTEERLRVRTYRAHLPYDTANVYVGDRVTVLTADDPHFANRVLWVVDVMFDAELGQRRIDMHDLTDDGEASY